MPKLVRCAITAFAVVTIFLISSSSTSAQFDKNLDAYYPISGVSHIHSTFSDGRYPIQFLSMLAKGLGLDYIIMCDHADDIEATSFDKVARVFKNPSDAASYLGVVGSEQKQHGIDAYLETCRQSSIGAGITVVPGLEVELGGSRDQVRDPSGDPNRSHILVVGWITADLFRELMDCVAQEKRMDDAQDEVAKIAHRYNCAVIVAHPFAGDPFRPGWYTFYKNRISNIDAVECFNIDDDKALEAMGLINRDPQQGAFKSVSAISGVDFHGILPWELKNFERISILMPGKERTGDYEKDCKLIANAIRNSPILALDQTTSWGDISQKISRQSRVYLGERCISMRGTGGITEDINLEPLSKMTYYCPDEFILSGLPVLTIDIISNDDTVNRLADAINNTQPLSAKLNETVNAIEQFITNFPANTNRSSERNGGSEFGDYGPSLYINTR